MKLRITHKRQYLIIIILLFLWQSSYSQRYIKDSIIVSFADTFQIPPVQLNVTKINDARTHPGNILSITEKKQYQYIPVDFLISLSSPLEKELSSMFEINENSYSYQLKITEFKSEKKTYFLKPSMYLNSTIQVYYSENNDSLQFGGELVYEEKYANFSIKPTQKDAYEKVLKSWQQHFLNDLSTLTDKLENQQPITLPNYRSNPYTGKFKNMYVGTDAILGLHFFAIDGEIMFSHREVNTQFQRKAYDVRYRNEKELEAIEFDLFNTHLNYRLNEKYLFNAKGNLFIGLNRWKNLEENDYKLYDMGMLELSFSQRFIWNPLDKKSFIFGAGLFESVNYIYHYSVRFQPGVLIHAGVKL
ncbi:MAG: hypothetical protein JXB49_11790 [Bacteroidales bacterium]|nr:hypothetical protein [Bacteroidales bacterium]